MVIGRNEGERLVRCLESLPSGVEAIVYVDSGSTDHSVDNARGRGATVVQLDTSLPFTAARARNAGLQRLVAVSPDIEFVQLVDGDCALAPGWIEGACEALRGDAALAIVCGRRREVAPRASIYNRLCDLEWDTPVGEARSCGGDALARMRALSDVGYYDARLIAGEEPELCARLRAGGWRIRRLALEMTRHDAAMTRFGQWWRRASRCGHARAEVSVLRPPLWRRELRSAVVWGFVFPAAALVTAGPSHGASLALLAAAYVGLWARITLGQLKCGRPLADGALYASACVIAKVAEFTGAVRYWANKLRGQGTPLIEYK